MKYKIEKNTVQETLILPLYSRKLCTELYPNLFQDETAVRLIEQIPRKTVAYSVPKNKSLIRTVDDKTARIRDFCLGCRSARSGSFRPPSCFRVGMTRTAE